MLVKLACINLRCNNMQNPTAVDGHKPVFSWQMRSTKRGTVQTKYRLTVAHTQQELELAQNLIWDTGEVHSPDCLAIPYTGKALSSSTQYFWRAEIWDNHGNNYAMAESSFETAFLDKQDWKALWIEPEQEPAYEEPFVKYKGFLNIMADIDSVVMRPAQLIRREFRVSKPVKKARAYVTAHGVYYCEVNGKRVGNQKLAPEFTAYDKLLQYQVYDVTSLLQQSGNAVGIAVGDGWYAGKVGMPGRSCQYGNKLAVLFQIEIEYTDGTVERVCSDEEGKSATGHIRYADLFVGEKHDATLMRDGFSTFGYDDMGWERVHILNEGYETLAAQQGPPVRILEERRLKGIWVSPKGETILDAGQVLTGYLRMRVQGSAGTQAILEYTETVDSDGNYLNNAQGRFTIQMDTFVMKGDGVEVFEPEFTFHGFRYVRLSGFPGKASMDDFDVLVVGSDLEQTGEFSCSDPRLNQLQHNIVWSQKGNMLSIPMDCPQREKQGWTGDAQIFAPTACYNMDMYLFFKRWLTNMRLEQKADGQVPHIIPYIKAYYPGEISVLDTHGSAGWGDACIIISWVLYRVYGRADILFENYEMMKRWLAYVQHTAETEFPDGFDPEKDPERVERMKYLWNTRFHFADWLTPSLSLDAQTGKVDMRASALKTKHIVPTCFYAYSADLLSQIAAILGNKEDEARYKSLYNKVRDAFIAEFVDADGRLETELQGLYVLALQIGLVPDTLRAKMAARLAQMIHENGDKLDTGFLSVPFLLDVLVQEKYGELAFDLLFQDQCPSWLYEVKMGATTIWELWQAILPDGTVTPASFNHYAFGCVGDWMYRAIGGIREKAPGYKKIEIRPLMDCRLTWAEARFQSALGEIHSNWEIAGGFMKMHAMIPPNATGTIVLPKAKLNDVLESGVPCRQADGVSSMEQRGTDVYVYVGSGEYSFAYPFSA